MKDRRATMAVLEVRPVEGGGNVRAFVVQRICGITIYGAKQPGQRPRLAMPDRRWTEADGEARYSPFVNLSPSLKQRVADAALVAWKAADGDSAA